MNLPFEDDNRIDWEKKRKSRRDRPAETDPITEDTEVILRKPKKKKKARKNRQLEYDDESGRMIVKRQRKRQQQNEWEELW